MRRLTIIFLTLILIASTLAYATKGDLNDDGVIDGKDALKIIMVIEGRIPQPEEDDPFWENADVFPLPGTEGRLMGDGQITKEDAYKILRMVVGLISEGEISGDFSESPPQVDGFDPGHGPAGTKVNIFGKNFVSGQFGENIVLFGNVPAQVHSATSKTLVTEVPQGAESSKIRVLTPGGEAVSPFEFSVTSVQDGQLVPPAGVAPTNYDLVNKFGDESKPSADGHFSVLTDIHGVTIHTALPKDGSDRVLLYLHLPNSGSANTAVMEEQEPTMDLLSTAQAMVFLTPYFCTLNTERAQQHVPYILDDPKVAEFAQVLGQLYQETPEPFDDPRFETAYKEAIKSVIERMPDELVVDLRELTSQTSTFPQQQRKPNRLSAENSKQVQVIHIPPAGDEEYETYEWQEKPLSMFFPDKVLTFPGYSWKGSITHELLVNELTSFVVA